MNKRYPSADQPLNYEHVLFNHLECMSFFVAQGVADLKQMIEIFEQLVIPKTNNEERELLALFKLVISDLRGLVEGYYKSKMEEVQKRADKPEIEAEELERERDETLDDLDNVYYKLLLRFLVVLSQRRQDRGVILYTPEELFRDLKIELRDILPFDVSIVDEVINSYVRRGDTVGNKREATMEAE